MIMKENILPAVVSTKGAAITLLLTTAFLLVFWPVDSFASQWSEPVRIFSPSWGGECYNRWPSINIDGTVVAYLTSDGSKELDNESKIMFVEYADGSWSTPFPIAANGHYSSQSFQSYPA